MNSSPLAARTTRSVSSRREGAALVIALWATVLLSMLVASLTFEMGLEGRIASVQRKRFKADALALGGVEWAKLLLLKSQRPPGEDDEYEEEFRIQAINLNRGLGVSGVTRTLGDGDFLLNITPEQGRRNVNTLEEEDWKKIFEQSGVPDTLWDELIATFLDWTDENDIARLKGAESDDDYYRDRNIKVKNGPIATIDELLLIKGFDRRILYGGPGLEKDDPPLSGIAQWLTVWGDGKININAASPQVLNSMPELDSYAVDNIIAGRPGLDEIIGTEDDGYQNVDQALNAAGLSAEYGARMTASDNQYFRVESRGRFGGEEKVIYTILQRAGGNDITPIFWREEYTP